MSNDGREPIGKAPRGPRPEIRTPRYHQTPENSGMGQSRRKAERTGRVEKAYDHLHVGLALRRPCSDDPTYEACLTLNHKAMRRAAYVGASAAAAAAVVLKAFHERPNFYSATVYLGQSTACRMILLNMLLLTLAASMYGLQRLLYGSLRAIEVEQLWDKAWYAITETALAMTTFRDEVGGYFFLMFMTLLAGKVWGWIGEGRVETMEQQPPAHPKTFYARLTTSLVISELFDLLMLRYCVQTILDQRAPKAGMMIMFIFEFAILSINSASTLSRYGLALWERLIIRQQTQAKIEERREEIRAERELAARRQGGQPNGTVNSSQPSLHERIEVDENEIDVPGWQEKGKWVLFLDLTTDFLKLVFYMTFFLILILFAGLPIHMFRDLFITTRSFLKRINDYLKYRNATRDMNTRYPDATPEELRRDGTCIICREEMRPWQAPPPNTNVGQNQTRAHRSPPDERQRPKKLPCGHILHFGCLRSWLERQQVCPTCRRSVLAPGSSSGQGARANGVPPNPGNQQAQNQQQHHDHAHGHAHGQPHQQGNQQGRGNLPGINRMRTFNFGGYRLTFATGQGVNVRDAINQMQNQGNDSQGPNGAVPGPNESTGGTQNASTSNISTDLNNIQARLLQEANNLQIAQSELRYIHAMAAELGRLRSIHSSNNAPSGLHTGHSSGALPPSSLNDQQFLSAQPQAEASRAGDANLPEGMTLPEGWSLLPLNRVSGSHSTMNFQFYGQMAPQVNGTRPQTFQNEPQATANTAASGPGSRDRATVNTSQAMSNQPSSSVSNVAAPAQPISPHEALGTPPRTPHQAAQSMPPQQNAGQEMAASAAAQRSQGPVSSQNHNEQDVLSADNGRRSEDARRHSTSDYSSTTGDVPQTGNAGDASKPNEQTSNGRVDSQPKDIPQWSSAQDQSPETSARDQSQTEKGKGRAAHVEDAEDSGE
ncbi:MAG: hypothetical protein Q9162_001659 [Coniocarpon cinnabarinum]